MAAVHNLILAAVEHDPKDHVVPHGLVQLLPKNLRLPLFQDQAAEFWLTNHLLMTLVAAALMLVVFGLMGRRYRAQLAGVPVTEAVPSGFISIFESLLDALRTAVVRPVLGGDTDRFMPFLWTVFFFILFSNLLGMIPLDAIFQISAGKHHWGGTATGNINVTAGLALCAFAMIHFSGIAEVFRALKTGTYGHHAHDGDEGEAADHGSHAGHTTAVQAHGHAARATSAAAALIAAPLLYAWNFAPHVFKPGPEVQGLSRPMLWFCDVIMWAVLFVLELIGAVVKPFALCMRLFANMIAGHIVLASLLLLIPVFTGVTVGYMGSSLTVAIGCALMSCLELFVCFLQAYIFMFLTAMFIGAAIHPEH